MHLGPVALIYLGSFAFLGADSARLDFASEFRKKWNKWALSRGKRELRVPGNPLASLGEVKTGPVQTFIRTQDVKGASRTPQPSPEATRIRVKRYRQSMNSFPHFQSLRIGCRFGTCTLQNLAHQIYQLTDKDKDGSAPPSKISPQGYGRRRRRALAQGSRTRTLSSSSSPSSSSSSPGRLQLQ
ncbi:pro-adrenomedullin isoform X2 [Macrotis lagotis]|uniref:pro-adrenomedullin isoform X2 n=1 Tax=Macrotis lagotis TaxID=92651 RepID=UPI003D688EF3